MTGLSAASALLFDQGLVNALIALGAVGLLGVPFLLLVLREQARQPKSYIEVPSDSAPSASVGS